jgi:hypothetical protein
VDYDGDGVIETTYDEWGRSPTACSRVGAQAPVFGQILLALERCILQPGCLPYFYTAAGAGQGIYTQHLAASFNLAYSYKAGNAVYVHNAKYIIQILRDGLQALNGAAPPGTRPRGNRNATDYRTIVITP